MATTPNTIPCLNVPPGVYLTARQAQRLTALALVLSLVAGRQVPIQVVERLARWVDDGGTAP